MLQPLTQRFMAPSKAGGVFHDGMRLYVRQQWLDASAKSTFLVGLYFADSVDESNGDSFHALFQYVDGSLWYPVASSDTLEQAFIELETKLQFAEDMRAKSRAADWCNQVWQVAYQFTKLDMDDRRIEFDPNEFRLWDTPDRA